MIEVFLQKEDELKKAAENAAKSGDWPRLLREADSLVKLYGAIIASEVVAPDSLPRWQGLREKWQEIARQAKAKAAQNQNGRKSKDSVRQDGDAKHSAGVSEDRKGEAKDARKPQHTLKLADVKGLADAKKIVMNALVNPVKHPDIYKTLKIKSGKGLLLYGPPGTGKTMFARAIAGEMGMPFIYKKISELKDKYVGESEKGISRLFEEAYSHKQSVVFLDECESLLPRRGNQKVNIVEAFLAEIDGFDTNRDSQIFVLLATNRPWLLDSAVTRSGRIGAAVYVGLPDAETRHAIVSAALRDVPLADDVSIDEIVSLTEGYSGAELNHSEGGGVCNVAVSAAGERWVKRRSLVEPDSPEWSRVEKVTRNDFLDAINSIIPVSKKDPEIVRRNLNFSLGGGVSSDGQDNDN